MTTTKTIRRGAIGWLVLCLAGAVQAALPDAEQVATQLRRLPEVQAAEATLRASQAAAERLGLGPHEFAMRVGGQQRRVREVGGGVEQGLEPQVSLERAVRWPGKAEQDRRLAEAGLVVARLQLADAMHETGRALLHDWYALRRDLALAQLAAQQRDHQAALVETSRKRVQAGDAARSELTGLQAALAQLEAARVQAQAKADAGLAAWRSRYVWVAPPAAATQDEDIPQAPEPAGLDAARERLTEGDHGVRLARAEAAQMRLRAERTAQDERPDPTLGMHWSREQQGRERLVGISVTLPLGGAGRRADSRQIAAEADAAAARAEQRRLERQASAASQTVMAGAAVASWRAQAEAEAQAGAALQAAQRGWSLGEYAVGDVHLARRAQSEAAQAALSARLDALYQQDLLRLDLHEFWDFDDD